MTNSVDLDETAHYELSHLDLRCLQKPFIIAFGSERVKKHIISDGPFTAMFHRRGTGPLCGPNIYL